MIEELVGQGAHNSKPTLIVGKGSLYCEVVMQCCCLAVMPARMTYIRAGD
jgi:hypothetical protein